MHSRRLTSASSLIALIVSASACGLVACGSGDDAVIDNDTGVHDDTTPFDSGTFDVTPKDTGKDSGVDSTVDDTGTDTADSTVADTGTDTADSTAADTKGAGDTATIDTADSTVADAADAADTTDALVADTADAADAVVADTADAVVADTTDAASDTSDAGPAATEVWVVRVNTGTAVTDGAATFVDKFLANGTSKGSITLPGTTATAPQHLFTLASGAATEGALSLSGDGHYVTLGGYGAAIGTATVATGTTRVVARIDAAGTVDTSTTLASTVFSPFRSVVTSNGTDIWAAGTATGTNGGVHYVTLGGTTDSGNLFTTAPTNVRTVNIFGGQLYIATASSPYIGLSSVGTGLPTVTGQTATLLTGFPGATAGSSPYAFAALDLDSTVAGIDTLYVADDGAGIQRWKLTAGTWTKSPTTFTDVAFTVIKGVAAQVVGADVVVYGSNTTAIFKFTDVGGASTTSPAFTKIADAPASSAFRGIALAPK